MNDENWSPIAGFVGEYEISTLGRVKSLARIIPYRDGRDRPTPECFLKPTMDATGYYSVGLRSTKYRLHVLVLETFVGPRPDGFQACHFNCDKSDNRLENLRWDSRKENFEDTRRAGRYVSRQGRRGKKWEKTI